jgi:hypothetical protein
LRQTSGTLRRNSGRARGFLAFWRAERVEKRGVARAYAVRRGEIIISEADSSVN